MPGSACIDAPEIQRIDQASSVLSGQFRESAVVLDLSNCHLDGVEIYVALASPTATTLSIHGGGKRADDPTEFELEPTAVSLHPVLAQVVDQGPDARGGRRRRVADER